jgi:hypothetical protein
MRTQQRQRKKEKRIPRPGSPHKKLRRSCIWCRRVRHIHTRSGNVHRFHGPGSFCRTHRTTRTGRLYCNMRGVRRRVPLHYQKRR